MIAEKTVVSFSTRQCLCSPRVNNHHQCYLLSKCRVGLPSAIAPSISSISDNKVFSDVQPCDYDIVCGRGKGSYNRPGNQRFRAIVCQHIPVYSAAKTKFDKGIVLNSIVSKAQSESNGAARFLKCTNGSWFEIEDDQAREKVGHTIREAILAQDNAKEREESKKTFFTKQKHLLALQKAIFEILVNELEN
jgi:hypothetical protein